jgi:hypothetical protein
MYVFDKIDINFVNDTNGHILRNQPTPKNTLRYENIIKTKLISIS